MATAGHDHAPSAETELNLGTADIRRPNDQVRKGLPSVAEFFNKELKLTEGAALMTTGCTQNPFGLHPHFRRKVGASCDVRTITSHGGVVLLREVERLTGLIRRLANFSQDHLDPEMIEHHVFSMVAG